MDSQQLKMHLMAFNQHQEALFPAQNIQTLLLERSHFYDELLTQLWQQYHFATRDDLALIAVGGYGRQEMFPLSDLDILVLSMKPLDEPTHQQLNQLFNLLWDSKLQLGSSIRTIDECLEIGKQELSIATNMFESRFILGNKQIWQTLMSRLFQDDFWAMHAFFDAKMEEKRLRYARYHNTSYNLEPDLKHSPGGLRDLHLISWIMLRHYGTNNFSTLAHKGILYPEELHELEQAAHLLFKMRFALHLQLKRYDNRLRFDRQLQLSEQLGFNGEGNQAVEQMMKLFFQATQSILQISHLILHDFKRNVIDIFPSTAEKQSIDDDFILQGQRIFTQNSHCFSQRPHTILLLFYHLTQYPDAEIDISTLRQLRLALKKQPAPLCQNAQARSLFIQLFSQPDAIHRAIVPMHQFGVLTAYLPQWREIEGLMQFDLFHIYTVDEHSIRVMRQLEFFLCDESQEKFPLCHKLFRFFPHRQRLYLAALFHDIAKGRKGDHAINGAVDIREFATLHGFSTEEANEMAWLVEQHLTMSITAQRRDIHDPNVVQHFAQIVKHQTALDALTCLTVADIHATNETLWNDWKRTLFTQLHQFTSIQLMQGDTLLDQQRLAKQHQLEAMEQIKFILSAQQQKQLEQFWQHCPRSYFIRHNPTQLVWHALAYVTHDLSLENSSMVLVSNQYARGATEIFIYGKDKAQLFANIAHALSQKKISIHDAQIITSRTGIVLDSFIVTEQNGQPLNTLRCQQIQTLLSHILNCPLTPFSPIKNPIKHRSFKGKTTVRFLAETEANQTAFELFTPDREGLLAQISNIFNQHRLNLLSAKITTIGEKVEDFFVVTTAENKMLTSTEKEALATQLYDELS